MVEGAKDIEEHNVVQSLEAIKIIYDQTDAKKAMTLQQWPGYKIWLKNPDKFTKMLRDYSQYDIVPKDKIYKIKVLLNSYSGDGKTD